MAKDLPYLATYKNVGTLFDKIEKAKIPDAFTVRFLADTVGLKGSGDRQLISLLKKLGFLDNAGKPTPEYSELKNKTTAKAALAQGIRKAYAPLFEANEEVHALPNDQLKGLVAQVSGAEEAMTKLITYTFNALVKAADFTQKVLPEKDKGKKDEDSAGKVKEETSTRNEKGGTENAISKFNPDFRFNIEIHLPSNGIEETYLAIFNALRKSLG